MLIITTQTLAISKAHPPNTSIFFKGNHIYHAIIVHVNANINNVHISGINKIIERTIKFIIVNWTKNLLTNPLLNAIIIYVNIFIGIKERNISLIFLEIFVVFIEGFIYQKVLKYKKINCYLLSLILNFSSCFLGTIINCKEMLEGLTF